MWNHHGSTKPGEKLWDFNSAQLLKQLKEQLKYLGIVEYVDLTWKSFRAGKATEMANDRFGLGQIFLAEKVNPCKLLCTAIDESEGE